MIQHVSFGKWLKAGLAAALACFFFLISTYFILSSLTNRKLQHVALFSYFPWLCVCYYILSIALYLLYLFQESCVSVAIVTLKSTHWNHATHICVRNLTIIGSDNGLSPGWCQNIFWHNAGILLGINFSWILTTISTFSVKKINFNIFCHQNGVYLVSASMCWLVSFGACGRFLLLAH